jgi:hypothetical protein
MQLITYQNLISRLQLRVRETEEGERADSSVFIAVKFSLFLWRSSFVSESAPPLYFLVCSG